MQFHTEITEAFGYVAAGLVLGTFVMRTMIPLRVVAIASNIAFMSYGFFNGLLPVFLLHLVLLPVNVYRLVEMLRLIAKVRDASQVGSDMTWLVPYMKSVSFPAGAILFRKGDDADAMFLVTTGRIRLEEFEVELGAGELLGEMGVFSTGGKRTATAMCVDPCRLHSINRDKVRELVLQNPHFGFYLLGIVADRLIEDLNKIRQSGASDGGALAAQT